MFLGNFSRCVLIFASISALNLVQAATNPNDLVTNGDFSAGETGWEYWNHHGGVGNAKIVDGQLVYQVTTLGTSSYWDVQVNTNQSNLFALTNGTTYVLSFDAKCKTVIEDTMLLFAVEDGDKGPTGHFGEIAYDPNGVIPVKLTTSMQTFTSTFTMAKASTTKARLTFNVGGTLNTITFDNISLIDKSKIVASHPRTLSSSASELSIKTDSRGISFRIADPAHFQYSIYNPAGRLIAGSKSFNKSSNANYRVDYKALGISSGMYVVQACDGNQRYSSIFSVNP
jgi:hypothetical protein